MGTGGSTGRSRPAVWLLFLGRALWEHTPLEPAGTQALLVIILPQPSPAAPALLGPEPWLTAALLNPPASGTWAELGLGLLQPVLDFV